MQLYGALTLLATLSAAYGLRCYTCTAAKPSSCTDTVACSGIFGRCFSLRIDGYTSVTKGCQARFACVGPIKCCKGDLCNGAGPGPGSGVTLLLVPSVLIALLL